MKQEKLESGLPDGVTIKDRSQKQDGGYQAYKKSFDDAMKETIDWIESKGRKAFVMKKTVKITVVTPQDGDKARSNKAKSKQEITHYKPLILWVDHASTTTSRIRKYESKGWPLAWTNFRAEDAPPKDERLQELKGVIAGLQTARESQELTDKYMNTAKEKYEQRSKKA